MDTNIAIHGGARESRGREDHVTHGEGLLRLQYEPTVKESADDAHDDHGQQAQ